MDKIMLALGFKQPEIGRPLTEAEMCANRRIVLALAVVLIACVGVPFAWGVLNAFAAPAAASIATAVPMVLGTATLVFWEQSHLVGVSRRAGLSPASCATLLELANEHDDVRSHLAAINQQGRAITRGDAQYLHHWSAMKAELAKSDAQREACVALHLLGNN